MAIFILKFEMSTVNFSNIFVITLGLETDSWSGSEFRFYSDAAKAWLRIWMQNRSYCLVPRQYFITVFRINFPHRCTLSADPDLAALNHVYKLFCVSRNKHDMTELKEKNWFQFFCRPSSLIDCVLTRTTIQYSWARRPWYRWCRKTPGNTTMTRHMPCR